MPLSLLSSGSLHCSTQPVSPVSTHAGLPACPNVLVSVQHVSHRFIVWL